MEKQAQVHCSENQELATYLFNKWKEMAEQPKGISENVEKTLSKAYYNVCNFKAPIETIKDLSQVKYDYISPHFVKFVIKVYPAFGIFSPFFVQCCQLVAFLDLESSNFTVKMVVWCLLIDALLSPSRGVGKWILRLMQGFFGTGSGGSEAEDLTKKGMSDAV